MSSAISKFTAALMAGSQETTVALASLNFDFSLYKVEAPREYQVLGQHLSDERRQQAEEGSQHVTARKLGAIFRSKLPKVPHLLEAFGLRVSEIAAASSNREGGKNGSHSSFVGGEARNIFAKNAGIDGTSLWAAATSGPEALCVQLLACMLARFWTSPQATSIWAEIVEARKAELKAQGSDFHFAEIAALNATIPRDQLAEWDASARSWLQTADVINCKKFTQLRLIIGNIRVMVNNTPDTYDSVMEAWIESMQVVDQLLAGVPQSVYNGTALLGLSAWHLYPNMAVHTNGPVEIVQNDDLFNQGGMLTIGLLPSDELDNGVRWSLPLAKLRYYGQPTIVNQALDYGSSKVSFMELIIATLGSLARCWPQMPDKFVKVCQYYKLLERKLKDCKSVATRYVSTISVLGKASTKFLAAKADERNALRRLMEFGHRHGADFLFTDEGPPNFGIQMLGLTRPDIFIKSLNESNRRVACLRKTLWANTLSTGKLLKTAEWIIMSQEKGRVFFTTVVPDYADHFNEESLNLNAWDDHKWWSENGRLRCDGSSVTEPLEEPWVAKMNNNSNDGQVEKSTKRSGRRENNSARSNVLFQYQGCHAQEESTSLFSKYYPDSDHMHFVHCFGEPMYAALYHITPMHGEEIESPLSTASVAFDDIFDSLQKNLLDLNGLINEGNVAIEALLLLGDIDYMYQDLENSGARVSLDVIRSPLSLRRCFSRSSGSPASQSAIAFSTIAYLESGDQDIDPTTLEDVMAMVIGDSIYSTSILTSDPHQDFEPRRLQRTFGNIGKPGISFIIPPPNPRIRRTMTGEWNVINHYNWDGKIADHFTKTSLHLCLTDYRVPYVTKHQGQRDFQAFLQEAAVSIYDGEVWVGDVDIVKALTLDTTLIKIPTSCKHVIQEHELYKHEIDEYYAEIQPSPKRRKKAQNNRTKRNRLTKEIVCADSWYEFLDKSNKPMVVRSHGNWIGRLATASLSAQLGYKTLLLPDGNCEHGCFSDPKFISDHLVKEGEVIIF